MSERQFDAGDALAMLCIWVLVGLPASVSASPWTLPDDSLAARLSYTFGTANQEYLPTAGFDRQPFPLNGQFSSGQLDVATRYGFTDKLEGEFGFAFKHVNYSADGFLQPGADYSSRDSVYESALIDFSDTRMGISHIDAALRYNFFDMNGLIKLTSETALKLPTGYDGPQGTFENGEVAPGGVEDDVTLGDGQTDLTQMAQFGFYIPPTRTFGRVDAGFRVRFGAPGHQTLGLVKVGQRLGKRVLVYGRVGGVYTVTDGEVIGQTITTDTPEKSARELSAEDLEMVDLRLDRDYLKVGGGVIAQFGEFELQFGYSYIPVGRNIPAMHSATVGSVFTIPNAMAGDEDEESGGGEDSSSTSSDE